ncbi:ABC transporter ATP-binding protein [Xanthomonas hortorum]|uniref:ABC transporter ATP-binding protein n=1 Tax=Xanthomonas hortorum TaxID=56454 RepID=UPI0029359C79|nr:ABC transporter ATP-binding protein [Xanthomonas hortorum]MDV2449664.1 ABC transporter ATP-binding protein [Xanthomonas hortorum NBC5720]
MSSEISIDVSGVSKVFPVYSKPHHRLLQMLSPRSRKQRWFNNFHALNDVTFCVNKGETVGIIGRNGSGKSTLLQIICGTLTASAGSCRTFGRIAALLELGAGFNPEFTGRENVYLNGTLLGLSREQVHERFDEIARFADIGDFIEQPVKSYSSGMFVRLAFAVAIHVEPGILIVDEALSVGDEAFQRKCFARIERLRDQGATIIFVSHSASTVLELCNRAILLDHGDLLAMGEPKVVVTQYQKMLYAPSDKISAIRASYLAQLQGGASVEADSSEAVNDLPDKAIPSSPEAEEDLAYLDPGLVSQSALRYESRGVSVSDPHIQTLSGRRVNVLESGKDYIYTYNASFERAAMAVRFGMLIKTVSGVELGGAVSSSVLNPMPLVMKGEQFNVCFRFRASLAPGTYFLNAGVTGRVGEEDTFLERLIDAAVFRIPPDLKRTTTGFVDFEVVPNVIPVTGSNAEIAS